MKKTVSILVACLLTAGLFGTACKKIDVKDLRYLRINKNKFLEAYVNKNGGGVVLWFQVHDRINEKTIIDSYNNIKTEIDKYPAKIYKDNSLCLLVNKRIEIRLTAMDNVKDFQDTDKLIKFIKLFDLAGMEKVTGPKLKPEELEKFMPKLGGK